MTDKHIPASKLLALPKFITFMEEDGSTGFESFESGTWIRADDLRALIYAAPLHPDIVSELVKALADDAYAASFQSMAGYRNALIAKVKGVIK